MLDEVAVPIMLSLRQIAFPVQEGFENELNRLHGLRVTEQVEEPIDYAKSGELRIHKYIALRPLTTDLKCKQFYPSVLGDLASDLADARFFTKADLFFAIYCVVLNEQSSKLTASDTLFGRYRW